MPLKSKFVLSFFALAVMFLGSATAKADSVIIGTATGANATATVTNVSLVPAGGSNSTFTFTLTNTSPFDARVTALGFDLVAGDFTGNNSSGINGFNGSVIAPAGTDFTFRDGSLGNVPQFNNVVIDFGFTTSNNGNFNGGSPNDGLDNDAGNNSAIFSVTGNFQGLTAAQIEAGIYVRFQRVGANGQDSDVGRPGGPPTTAVPEPATMMLLGTGLVGVAAKMRRRRRQAE